MHHIHSPTVTLQQQQSQNQRQGKSRNLKDNNNKKSTKSHHSSSRHLGGVEQPVPPCTACGSPREFEFQLVPPLLHVLQVDKYASGGGSPNSASSGIACYQQGGMDWGNIAVYACSNPACCGGGPINEFCVVQDSLDDRLSPDGRGMRQQRLLPQGEAVIPDNTHFEDDDGDGDEDDDYAEEWEEGDYNDDDDENW